jgi:hypothetical protein
VITAKEFGGIMARLIKTIFVALVAVIATLSATTAAQAVGTGHEGCTPGYWKNHTDSWQEAAPSDLYGSAYTSARANVAGVTMLDALGLPGGSGLDGAARILARASTAAWLNAAHDGVGYPWRRVGPGEDGRPGLVSTVNAAFESNDRATMLALAAWLDADNNLAECPLN